MSENADNPNANEQAGSLKSEGHLEITVTKKADADKAKAALLAELEADPNYCVKCNEI